MSIFLLISMAFATPQQYTQQGRLLDPNGAAITGQHTMTFRLFDNATGSNMLWDEVQTVFFVNGYYSVVLGANYSSNPLNSSVLSQYPLYLEIEVDTNGPLSPRVELNSTPYATLAGEAQSLAGGPADATQIAIGGSLVIDGNGSWVGPALSVNWSDISNVPADILDGDDDLLSGISCTQGEILGWDGSQWGCTADNGLTESEVEAFVENGPLNLASGTTINNDLIVTQSTDQDSFAALGPSCITGDLPKWDAALNQWLCDVDNVLDEATVDAFVENGALNLASGTTMGGDALVTASTDQVLDDAAVDTYVENGALNLASGTTMGGDALVTASTDQVLDDAAVDAYVENGPLNLSSGTTLDGNQIMTDAGCNPGEMLVWDGSMWGCTDLQSMFDNDGDGVMAWSDCDDNDATALSQSDDADCDGTLTADDCDDNDPASFIVAEDADCDGVLTADDCNDNNAALGDISLDADCDGTLFQTDCDDNDATSTTLANDADCDTVITALDCDDNDDTIGSSANDADCDGVDTANDCNDSDPTVFAIDGTANCPATSCKAILDSGASTTDGAYYLDPDGSGAFQTYCDMSNGGWTLMVNAQGSDATYASTASLWYTAGATGSELINTSTTGKSKGFDVMPLTELRLTKALTDSEIIANVSSDVDSGTSLLAMLQNSQYHTGAPGSNDGSAQWNNGFKTFVSSSRSGSYFTEDYIKIWYGDNSVDGDDYVVFGATTNTHGDWSGAGNPGSIGSEFRYSEDNSTYYQVWAR